MTMTGLTIQEAARRSGLSEPTLRYYEEVGLIGPIARDPSSGHRRYREVEVDTPQALACLRKPRYGKPATVRMQAREPTRKCRCKRCFHDW